MGLGFRGFIWCFGRYIDVRKWWGHDPNRGKGKGSNQEGLGWGMDEKWVMDRIGKMGVIAAGLVDLSL